jgi:hypothetical protein
VTRRLVVTIVLFLCGRVFAQDAPPALVQANLTDPGTPPFHLVASIGESSDPAEQGQIVIDWVSASKWRRTVQTPDFSQTLIVHGDQTYEEDANDYFPLALQTLATALVNPNPVLAAWRPGDLLLTKSNGTARESGSVCPSSGVCLSGPFGLTETVGGPGRSVSFMYYQDFEGVRVAHRLSYRIDHGDSFIATLVDLHKVEAPDESLFRIPKDRTGNTPILSVVVSESDLRQQALQPLEIIWPQVLDGKTEGETSYYVSLDRSGQVREVLPLSVEAERADESARRQILRWKFKPVMKDGVPVQAEAVFTFNFNTRAYGPREILTDEQARKLATGIVEPEFAPGTPSGSTCAVRAAVDSDGNVIEMIPGDCAPGLFDACMTAIRKWHFSPIEKNGRSLPYRAEILFRTP